MRNPVRVVPSNLQDDLSHMGEVFEGIASALQDRVQVSAEDLDDSLQWAQALWPVPAPKRSWWDHEVAVTSDLVRSATGGVVSGDAKALAECEAALRRLGEAFRWRARLQGETPAGTNERARRNGLTEDATKLFAPKSIRLRAQYARKVGAQETKAPRVS